MTHNDDMDECDRPPVGWVCSREAGHDGPCAAVPAGGGVREDEAAAVWTEMRHALADARTLARPHDPKVEAYWRERIGLVLDRVRAERAKGERIAHECNDPICQAFSRGYRQGRADAAEGGMVRLADVERWLQTDHRRRSTRCRYCGEDELRDICPESDRGIFSCSPTTVPIETHAEAFKREFGEARDDPRG